jgi:hypothetical protein
MNFWPTPDELSAFLTSSFPGSALDTSRAESALLAAQEELKTATRRTWEPVREVRYFSGNNSEMLTVDEYLEVHEIQLVRSVPQGVYTQGTDWWEVQRQGFPKTRISIYQGGAMLVFGFPLRVWPQGLENIKIDADWGFACELPSDVRQAVLYKAAAQIVNTAAVSIQGGQAVGPMSGFTDGDVSERYADVLGSAGTPSKAMGWDAYFDGVVKRYRRSLGNMRERTKPPLW